MKIRSWNVIATLEIEAAVVDGKWIDAFDDVAIPLKLDGRFTDATIEINFRAVGSADGNDPCDYGEDRYVESVVVNYAGGMSAADDVVVRLGVDQCSIAQEHWADRIAEFTIDRDLEWDG